MDEALERYQKKIWQGIVSDNKNIDARENFTKKSIGSQYLNPLTPKISLVTLLTVNHTIIIMLVQRI